MQVNYYQVDRIWRNMQSIKRARNGHRWNSSSCGHYRIYGGS